MSQASQMQSTVSLGPQTAVTNDFRQHVHNWLTHETEAKALQYKLTAIRAARNEEEATIVAALRSRGMEKAALQTRLGTINMAPHTSTPNLSFSLLEEILPGYFASVGQRNQTAEVISYIKHHRKSEKEYTLEFKPAPIGTITKS